MCLAALSSAKSRKERKEILVKSRSTFALFSSLAIAAVAMFAPNKAQAVTVYKPVASISYANYVYVSWRADSRATAFRVYRGTTTNFKNAVVIGTVSSSTRAVRDWTAKLGVKYYYWIASRVGNTYYYGSSRYDYGFRLMTVTLSQGWSNGNTKRWIGGYANGSYINNSGASWSLTKSGVGTWHKYRNNPYLGYFTSNKRGTTKWTLKVGTTAPVTFKRTITWR